MSTTESKHSHFCIYDRVIRVDGDCKRVYFPYDVKREEKARKCLKWNVIFGNIKCNCRDCNPDTSNFGEENVL